MFLKYNVYFHYDYYTLTESTNVLSIKTLVANLTHTILQRADIICTIVYQNNNYIVYEFVKLI